MFLWLAVYNNNDNNNNNCNMLWRRSDECDVRVQLPEVSREHCKLVLTEKGQVSVYTKFNLLDIYHFI